MNKKVMAYARKDGRAGFRNYILILSSVSCANQTVSLLKQDFNDEDEIIAITHQHGCDQGGEDREQTLNTLAGIASNPNVAAVLVIGLGCEATQAVEIAARISDNTDKFIATIEIQSCGGITKALNKGKTVITDMKKSLRGFKRKPISLDKIILGVKCGGSDAFSGISANPATGIASDLLVDYGGTVILSETPELIGAEHILQRRCINKEVARKLKYIVDRFEKKALNSGIDIRGTNPTPGNINGGITTLEEKSLGSIYKGGSTPIKEVIEYAETPTKNGLLVMDSPGNDIESISGMSAAGAQIIVFTTGLGTPAGSPVSPTIKVATNNSVYDRMKEFIDINSGEIIKGNQSVEQAGKRIFNFIIEVAEGRLTRQEKFKQFDFAINRIGPTF